MRYLFAMLPGAGHVNPTLAVVAELVWRGEDVEYWSGPAFEATVRATGAQFRPLAGPSGVPAPGRRPSPVALLNSLVRAPRPVAERAAAAPRDTVVVYDSMAGWGERLGGLRSVAFATSTLVNGPMIADGIARVLPGAHDVGANARRARWLLRSGLPGAVAGSPLLRPLVPRSARTIVAVPREFQPNADLYGPVYAFVGPCLAPRPADADDPLLDRLDPTRPLVLVALGSAFTHRPDFYTDCLRAFDATRWQVLIAADRTDIGALGPVPNNAIVVPRVPQLRVLERAAAFVSHGGMGSVMESLHHGVPLVLFPQMIEQGCNADRVVAAGAGRRLPRAPTPGQICDAVEHVALDPAVASAVGALRRSVTAAGGYRRAADVLQEFAATGPLSTEGGRQHDDDAGRRGSTARPGWSDRSRADGRGGVVSR